jgi:hypothetical protein
MWEKGFSQIQKQYRFEEANNVYLIEVSLDDYDDVFNEWDPAPFKKRFIEEEFDEFVVSSSEDIPLKFNLNIILYIPEQKKYTNKEKSVVSAYKNYYLYASEKVEKSWIKLRKKDVSYFILATIFLSSGYFLQYAVDNVVVDVIKEGIFIGGWVFLWEVFTNIFIKRRKLRTKYKIYKRLYLSDIRFIYS